MAMAVFQERKVLEARDRGSIPQDTVNQFYGRVRLLDFARRNLPDETPGIPTVEEVGELYPGQSGEIQDGGGANVLSIGPGSEGVAHAVDTLLGNESVVPPPLALEGRAAPLLLHPPPGGTGGGGEIERKDFH